MAYVPIQQARQLLTQSFLGAWKETFPVTNFFRSFFETKTSSTEFISIEVQPGTRMVASDILRGVEGNKNNFGLSTQKVFVPPYYAENFNNTSLALYNQIANYPSDIIDSQLVAESVKEITDNYIELKNKIERAYELQASQAFQTGIVKVVSNDSIDYKAKGTHIYTLGTGNWWSTTTATTGVFKQLQTAMNVLKQDGALATEFNLILGATALDSFLNCVDYTTKFGLYPREISMYNLPRRDKTTGAVFQNRIGIGPYIVNVWSYNEMYTDANGATQYYLNPKNALIIAESFKGFMSFAAVPRVLTDNGMMQNQQFASTIDNGAYIMSNYVKPEVSAHVFELKSAGLAVPLTIDHFSSIQVIQ